MAKRSNMDKKRILIVEDEPEMVNMLRMRLESLGYEILVAMDGQEGLKKARTEKPDLIILDLMLPKMDGYKICGLLKADQKHMHIPIIILTARAQDEDRDMGLELGADAYIIKPFEPKNLVSTIKKLIK